MTSNQALRRLPSVDRICRHRLLAEAQPSALRVEAARSALSNAREAVRSGAPAPDLATIAAAAVVVLERMRSPSLRRVINASGVILHTNLGRSPLSDAARRAMEEAAAGYSNLEFELESGSRGSRFQHLDGLLQQVTGAEAGIAVNNNAAAVLLTLAALCRDREVIISRGQAVEIGGGFRIPDVLLQSGAVLVEVGTTNRTSLADFAAAITNRTAAILRVHASNFRIVGFTSFPELKDLAQLAHGHNLLLLDDLGSGCLLDTRRFGMLAEPTVQESVAAGVDITAFSGDKLLGGPQAGILVGRADCIAPLRRHPLARALRMDKSSIAALAATLLHYVAGEELSAIPIWRAISMPLPRVAARARRWALIAPARSSVAAGRTMIGGGSLPAEGVETRLLVVRGGSPSAIALALRNSDPPIVARVSDETVLLDPRTVSPSEDQLVGNALQRLLGPEA